LINVAAKTKETPMKYRFVETPVGGRLSDMTATDVAPEDLEAWCAARGIVQTGTATGHSLDPRLQGHPTFEGFVGPSAGDKGIVRYEDQRSYEILSM
jgi:hypothetical protein